MDHTVERELTVPEEVEEVWRSLAEPEWLGDDATIELREAGEVRAGERDGFWRRRMRRGASCSGGAHRARTPRAWRSTSTRPTMARVCA